MDTIILAVLIVVISLVIYHWSRRRLYLLSLQLPGPPALPIIGNSLPFLFNKSEDILNVVMKLIEPHSSPMRLWLGPKLVIFITDPNQLQIVMQSSKMSTKSFVYRFLEPFLGKGLFTSAGTQHKLHRKFLQPLFGPKYLDGYSHLFQKHAAKLVKQLRKFDGGQEFDILHLLHESAFEATMDILLEDKNDHSIDYKDCPAYVRRFYHIFSQRVLTFWLYSDFIYRRTKHYKEQEHMVNVASVLIKEIRDARLPEIAKNLESKFNSNIGEQRIPSIMELITEMLMEQPNALNDQEFLDHMNTFVVTSQDTQSSAIAFTLMMLGMYQDKQEKVFEELREAIGDKKEVNIDDTKKLSFMEMCIKEAMRLFPLGPFLIRQTTEDFQLSETIKLPQGCEVVLGVYHAHKNPNLWEKPEEFFPEHFTPEATATRHPFAYLPFSAGPRRCIAQQYSYVNMKIIIGNFLQNYQVFCDYKELSELKLMVDISIRPIDGYKIRIQERST